MNEKARPEKAPAMSPSDIPVEVVLDRATGPRRTEVHELLELFRDVSGEEPVVWAGHIVGFGEHPYEHPSGRTGISPVLAFAPAGSHHTIYLVEDFAERWPDLIADLGKHRASKVCLYLTRLSNVDRNVLRELLVRTRDETLAS